MFTAVILSQLCIMKTTSSPNAVTRPRTVFLHYLPWFTIQPTAQAPEHYRRGWCGVGPLSSGCSDTTKKQYVGEGPLIGEYDQHDIDVLEHHLLLAQSAGVNVLLINCNPVNLLQVEITKLMFTVASNMLKKYGSDVFRLQLAISYDNNQATTREQVRADFTLLAKVYATDNRTVSFTDIISGGPVIILWSENVPEIVYAVAKEFLSSQATVVVRNPRAYAYSDGNFAWILPKSAPFEPGVLATYWGEQALKDFEWGMSHQDVGDVGAAAGDDSSLYLHKNQLAMGAVYPGFDDTNVPTDWNNGVKRKVLRHVRAGSTYELTWNHILGFISNRYGGGDENIVDMPWVQIITWNDYPEGTQIEPRSGLNGTATYEQTLLYISRWKGDEVNEGGARDRRDA